MTLYAQIETAVLKLGENGAEFTVADISKATDIKSPSASSIVSIMAKRRFIGCFGKKGMAKRYKLFSFVKDPIKPSKHHMGNVIRGKRKNKKVLLVLTVCFSIDNMESVKPLKELIDEHSLSCEWN